VRNTTLVRKDKYSHPVSIYISELLASTILSTGGIQVIIGTELTNYNWNIVSQSINREPQDQHITGRPFKTTFKK